MARGKSGLGIALAERLLVFPQIELSKDYEKTVESSEAMRLWAFISFLLPNVVI